MLRLEALRDLLAHEPANVREQLCAPLSADVYIQEGARMLVVVLGVT